MSEKKRKSNKIQVEIREPVYTEFLNYVVNKYGKTHTVLGMEVSDALAFYLKHLKTTRTHTPHEETESIEIQKETVEKPKHKKPPQLTSDNNIIYGNSDSGNNGRRSPTMNNVYGILNYIIDIFNPTAETELHEAHFERAILNVVGGDDRTHNKYMRYLQPYIVMSDDEQGVWHMDMERLEEEGFL